MSATSLLPARIPSATPRCRTSGSARGQVEMSFRRRARAARERSPRQQKAEGLRAEASSVWKSAAFLFSPCSLFQVCRKPAEKCLVPEFAVLRLQHPVAFIGEEHQLRRYSLPLQRRETFP